MFMYMYMYIAQQKYEKIMLCGCVCVGGWVVCVVWVCVCCVGGWMVVCVGVYAVIHIWRALYAGTLSALATMMLQTHKTTINNAHPMLLNVSYLCYQPTKTTMKVEKSSVKSI